MKHLSDDAGAAVLQRPDIPPDLDLVVLRALAKDPDDRYPDGRGDGRRPRARRARRRRDRRRRRRRRRGALAARRSRARRRRRRRRADRRPPAPPAVPPRRSLRLRRAARRRPSGRGCSRSLLVVAAGVGGWYASTQIQDQLNGRTGLGAVRRRHARAPAVADARDDGPAGARRHRAERHDPDRLVYRAGPGGRASGSTREHRHDHVSPASRRSTCPTWSASRATTRSPRSPTRGLKRERRRGLLAERAGHGRRAGPEAGGAVVRRARRSGSTSRRGRSRSRCRTSSGSRTSRRAASCRARASPSRGSDVDSNAADGDRRRPGSRGANTLARRLDGDAVRLEGPDRRRTCRT